MTIEIENKYRFLIKGAISPQQIANSIAKHNAKKNIGAHEIFLGQVRADVVDSKEITAIDYSAYEEMVEKEIETIRENIINKYQLTCAHVLHSIGRINAGEICFFVFVSSPHRNAAFDACREMVELIKKDTPIFGKEIFKDESYRWKANKI